MKTIITSSILLFFSLCYSYALTQNKKTTNDCACYMVYDIVLINNYYQIYAVRDTIHYKIISKEDSLSVGKKIEIGKCYNFILESMIKKYAGIKWIPINYMDIVYSFGETIIKIDGGDIDDLYSAKNVKGLYFIENYITSD